MVSPVLVVRKLVFFSEEAQFYIKNEKNKSNIYLNMSIYQMMFLCITKSKLGMQ